MRHHSHLFHFLAVLPALTGLFLTMPVSFAQTSSIVLIYNTKGNATYINNDSSKARAVSGDWRKTGTSRPNAPSAPALIQRIVRQSARRHHVDPKLVDAVIRVESAWDYRAVSSKGAMGLMQLIPATAGRFGVENPFDPSENIRGGVTYLQYLLGLFKGNVPLSLAAYNAGEHRVERDGGIPAIPETINYVRRVTSIYRRSGARLPARAGNSSAAPIYRYVDSYGVVHFSND